MSSQKSSWNAKSWTTMKSKGYSKPTAKNGSGRKPLSLPCRRRRVEEWEMGKSPTPMRRGGHRELRSSKTFANGRHHQFNLSLPLWIAAALEGRRFRWSSFLALWILAGLSSGCRWIFKPSYPAKKVAQSLVKLCAKEHISVEARR